MPVKKKETKSEKKQGSDPKRETRKTKSTVKSTIDPQKGKEAKAFPVVGMGASAGGLEAFELFFTNMPPETGMAFVLVPHLDPTHKSMMVGLLKRCTKMDVLEVEDGMKVAPNCLYVIPPNRNMGIMNGSLQLIEPTEPRSLGVPIDFFLRSLAQDQAENAIGIILSGTGTSGALGIKAIKGEGGMVMAQEPESAKYDGMPRSAIATGLADYVLPADKMPEQLIKYVKYSHIRHTVEAAAIDKAPDFLQKIFIILRSQSGHDFSLYKNNTINRRIERRMVVHQIDKISDYVLYLQQNSHEVKMLFKELLIGVTSFFRDPQPFKFLETEVLTHLLENRPPDRPVRIWVPGCSTGEEAYSIAMTLREWSDKHSQDIKVQIFATDIDSSAIETARAGIYPESIAVDVSGQRLRRFFIREGATYQIKKEIREMVVFALQDIIKDPPFSKLDLISCRNLLIYMGPELQKRLLPLFHYILKPDGILFLGPSETIGNFIDLFSVFNKEGRFFKRKEVASSVQVRVDFPTMSSVNNLTGSQKETGEKVKDVSVGKLAERILLDTYAPASVIINEKYDILYFYGRTGKYLEPAPGEAGLNILEMARQGLKYRLRSCIREALSKKADVIKKALRVKTNGEFQMIDLIVKHIKAPKSMQKLMMIIFEDVVSPKHLGSIEAAPVFAEGPGQRVTELEQELEGTKESLQTTIEELETSNEELKSTNEEMQSTNEELQSSNEELETSKEELQSLNEELTTVNTELQGKIDELSETNNDMKNLLESTYIPIIFLNNDLSIKRFTQEATRIINLIQTDIGRPVGDIASNLIDENNEDMSCDTAQVLATLSSKEKEVQTKDGHRYLMRIRPYRTTDNVIDGVVITFVDIPERKTAKEEMSQ